MTDWEKLKVTDLKEELKARGVPLTGLKLKQQFIDKLNELDAESEQGGLESREQENHDVQSAGEKSDHDEVSPPGKRQDIPLASDRSGDQPSGSTEKTQTTVEDAPAHDLPDNESNLDDATSESKEEIRTNEQILPQEVSHDDRMDQLANDLPVELLKEESKAQDALTPPPVVAGTVAEEKRIRKDDPFIPQQTNNDTHEDRMDTDTYNNIDSTSSVSWSPVLNKDIPQNKDTSIMEAVVSTDEQASLTRVRTPATLDDHRKRKRRSATPAPDVKDIARKRTKTDRGTPMVTESESAALEKVQEATDAAQAIRNPVDQSTLSVSRSPDARISESESNIPTEAEIDTKIRDTQRLHQQHGAMQKSLESSPDRDIPPAIHPATSSLYVRNFKRPLHLPTLRTHVADLARSSDGDPITLFYLDSIRTHAFISFKSVLAASRVRNAMHDTRFPNEPMREPLWIDFVPNEKIQGWIDMESGGGRGGFGAGRGTSRKYEVAYVDGTHGIEASLQEVSGTNALPQRPGVQQSRSNRMVPQDPTATAAVVSGLHPSRASLVPQSPTTTRARDARVQPPPQPSDPGKGFKALDELFSSTIAKPKLYYKLPPQTQIDDRLNMMRDLRVEHDQMGQSGDEGMKRYSFERDERSGREEWVDKGPEFGFGRRGQERLTGFGTSYGRGRGRGGYRGSRRGGDSWRGG